MDCVVYSPIGIILSPFKEPKMTPIQAVAAKGIEGKVEIFPKYSEGLKDIEGFSYIILIYHFHLSRGPRLTAKPYLDATEHGIFTIRSPRRPNPIGISTVRLKKIKNNILYIEDVDIVDRTPLLDIKPYIPEFDNREHAEIGWLKRNIHILPTMSDDKRCIK